MSKNIEYEIHNNELANHNFRQINNYIRYVLFNPIAASNTISYLKNSINVLKSFPEMGKVYNQNNPSIRFIIFKQYLFFYEINQIEKKIIILTILHSKQKRDIDKYLY